MKFFRNFMHNKYLENKAIAGFSQIDWAFLKIYILPYAMFCVYEHSNKICKMLMNKLKKNKIT